MRIGEAKLAFHLPKIVKETRGKEGVVLALWLGAANWPLIILARSRPAIFGKLYPSFSLFFLHPMALASRSRNTGFYSNHLPSPRA
jgi:hypothetical protein